MKNRRLWLGLAALLTAIVAVWLMQARISGRDLNASGPTSSSSGEGNSSIHPSILNVSGGETNSRKQVRPAKADGLPLPSKAEVTANPDGSVTIPAQLVSRIQFHPLNPDLSVNSAEMKLMGLSEEASQRLEDYVMSLGLDEIDKEAKNYEVLSQADDEITLKVSANPSNVNRELAKMHDSLKSIANDKAALLEGSLYGTLSHLTAGFGGHDKVIQLKRQADGEAVYSIIELLPESTQILSKANAPIDDYRRVALKTTEMKSKHVPERLKHLFTIE